MNRIEIQNTSNEIKETIHIEGPCEEYITLTNYIASVIGIPPEYLRGNTDKAATGAKQ